MIQKTSLTVATLSLIVFNILDTIFTIKYIKFGTLREANPLMDLLLHGDGCIFIFTKITATTLFSYFLWINRHRKTVKVALYTLSAFYFILMLIWIYMILLI